MWASPAEFRGPLITDYVSRSLDPILSSCHDVLLVLALRPVVAYLPGRCRHNGEANQLLGTMVFGVLSRAMQLGLFAAFRWRQ